MSSNHENELIKELHDILGKLSFYKGLSDHLLKKEPPIGDPAEEIRAEANLRVFLLAKIGEYRDLITELTGTDKTTIYEFGKPRTVDMWTMGLRGDYDYRSTEALNDAIVNLTMAISKLEREIDEGVRDKQGKKIGESSERPVESPLQIFDAMQFHPKVVNASRALFEDEHYAQAIFEAFKAVENFVQDKSGLTLYGTNLMERVFNEENPIIKVPEAGHYYKDVQKGFKHLFIGASQGIRNPKAHKEIIQKDPYITLQYLGFFSFLLKRIDYWEAGVS